MTASWGPETSLGCQMGMNMGGFVFQAPPPHLRSPSQHLMQFSRLLLYSILLKKTNGTRITLSGTGTWPNPDKFTENQTAVNRRGQQLSVCATWDLRWAMWFLVLYVPSTVRCRERVYARVSVLLCKACVAVSSPLRGCVAGQRQKPGGSPHVQCSIAQLLPDLPC